MERLPSDRWLEKVIMSVAFLPGLASRLLSARDNVPDAAMKSARMHLLDALCVGVAGSQWGSATDILRLDSGPGPCSLLGSSWTTSPQAAALINGSLIHSLEYDDTHTQSVVHGSSVLAPVALAIAEQRATDIDTMVAAFAVGWELLIRLGLSDPGGLQRRGFQVTPAAGVFAASAVSCLLSGDDVEKTARALSIAGSMASGTLAPAKRGDSAKAVQPGWAAHSGIMAAELARVGITGPDGVFHGSMGFFSLYGGADKARDFEQMIEDIGTQWHLRDAAFKMYPCCHYIHPFIEAAQSLQGEIGDSEITKVRCCVPEDVAPVVAEPWNQRVAPQTTQEARWSLPYAVAAAFVDGKVDLETFRGEPREDLITFAARIDYEAWSDSGFPRVFPARIEVTLSDGSVRACFIEDVLGNRDRPFTEEDVNRKARANLISVGFLPHRIDSILNLFAAHGAKSVQELTKLLEVRSD